MGSGTDTNKFIYRNIRARQYFVLRPGRLDNNGSKTTKSTNRGTDRNSDWHDLIRIRMDKQSIVCTGQDNCSFEYLIQMNTAKKRAIVVRYIRVSAIMLSLCNNFNQPFSGIQHYRVAVFDFGCGPGHAGYGRNICLAG